MTVTVSKPQLNLREELSALKKVTGVKGGELLRADTINDVYKSLNPTGYKNIIINGDFRISQRGTFTSSGSSATGTFYADRWFSDHSTWSVNRQIISADIPELPRIVNAMQMTAAAAFTGYIGSRQKIEFTPDLVGRTVTYSAYVKSNSSNARLTIYGATSAQVAASSPHSGSGQWERLSVTFTVATGTTLLYVDFFIATSGIQAVSVLTGDYIAATGLQLEIGTVATPYEYRSYQQELALCQRYYFRIGPYSGVGCTLSTNLDVISATIARISFQMPVPMRSSITALEQTGTASDYTIVVGGGAVALTAVPTYYSTGSNFIAQVDCTTAGGLTAGQSGYMRTATANAYLGWSAEL